MARRLAKSFKLLDHTVYTEYLKYDKIPQKHRVSDREELRKILKTICENIGTELVERNGGVHIRRLGYFFVWKIPRKMTYTTQVRNGKLKESYNHHTRHYMFSPIFLPSIDRMRTLKNWSMDNAFTRRVKDGIKEKVRAGFDYKIYPYSITKFNRK
jgi:hypothetical protein